MPYISQKDRMKYSDILDAIDTSDEIETKGDLEFLIFYLMTHYMHSRKLKYTELHNCVYAAQHCADEYRRRFLDKREDQAREQNGDI